VLILGGLIIIVIITIGAYILLSPGEQEQEENDLWVAEEGVVLSPNTTAVIILPNECPECNSSIILIENLKQDWVDLGTEIVETKTVYDTSEEGRNMIIRYKIEKLPALVLTKEGQWDSRILSTWLADIGSVEDDGSLVQREVVPPYYDTVNDTTRGKVEVIFINDKTCENCYDAYAFAGDLVAIFQFNVKDVSEYDISSIEGNAIVSEYGIKEIPTFLVSGEAGVYNGFDGFWLAHDNTQEDDGWYVFRDVKYLGVEYALFVFFRTSV
jgi:thiol-disulfide isomerase/thioredoxin